VHIDINLGRWYITLFSYEHNHDMLMEKYCGLSAAHKKLRKSDKIQIDNYGNAEIIVTAQFSSFSFYLIMCIYVCLYVIICPFVYFLEFSE